MADRHFASRISVFWGFRGCRSVFSWFFWASVNTTYRLSRYPSESLFPHVSTCSRPFGLVSTPFHTCARVFRPSVSTRYRLRHFPSRITDFDRPSFSITNQRFLGFSGLWLSVFVVFLGVREHDLPTFTVPIRIVVSTPFHRFPADSPPDSGFLGVREHDLPTFTVPIRIVVSTHFHRFLPDSPRYCAFLRVLEPDLPSLAFSVRPLIPIPFLLFPPPIPCFFTFPPVPGRLATVLGFSGRP